MLLMAPLPSKMVSSAFTLCNLDPNKSQEINFEIPGLNPTKVSGQMVTASKINAFNDFGKKDEVYTVDFKGAKIAGGKVNAVLPSKSVVLIQVQ